MSYIVKRLKDLKTARIDLINIQLQAAISGIFIVSYRSTKRR